MIHQPQLLPDQPSPDQVARDKPSLTTGAVLFFPRHQQKRARQGSFVRALPSGYNVVKDVSRAQQTESVLVNAP